MTPRLLSKLPSLLNEADKSSAYWGETGDLVDPLSATILVNATTIQMDTNLMTAIKEAYTEADIQTTEELIKISTNQGHIAGRNGEWLME